MSFKKGVMIGLVLVIISLSVVFSVSAADTVDKSDLSVKGLIKNNSLGVSKIGNNTVVLQKTPVNVKTVSVKEIETGSNDTEIIIAPQPTASPSSFSFTAWIKKILGIKDSATGSVSYISPKQIVSEENTPTGGEVGVVTETENPTPAEQTSAEPQQTVTKEGAKVIIVKETDLVNLVPNAYDPDKDLLKYTFTSPLDSEGKWQTTYGDAGQYTITVTASDGELSSSKEVLLIVNKKEEPPTITASEPDSTSLEANENSQIKFSVTATDLNKDTLQYSWKLDGNEVSTTEGFTYNITYNDAGSHTVKLSISDGVLETTKLWSVKVNNVNRPPVLENIPDITVKEGDTVKIVPKAYDPDGDEIKYTISDPVGDTGEWTTTYNDSGEYIVKVTASDGIDSVSQDVKVTVINVDRPPVITDIVQR